MIYFKAELARWPVGFDTWRLRGTLNGSGSKQFGRSLSGDDGDRWVDGG